MRKLKMIFLFSSQVKKNIVEFCNVTLFLLFGGAVLSLFARYHWFFNLFDQFWYFYLIFSIMHLLVFLVFKKYVNALFSLFLLIMCISIACKVDLNPFMGRVSPRFKIYYHNVNLSNSSLEELSHNIKKEDTEIAALVEVTPEIENVLTRNLSDYSNRFSLARDDQFGFLILSKLKFKLEEIHERMGIPVYVKIFVEKENVKIYILHLPPPLWREAWKIQNETLALIANEINKNKEQSVLIIGDFNMTTSSSLFQDFYKKLNLEIYTQELFYQGTWPSFMSKHLSLPIDHVLSSRKFEMEIGEASGSDHKSIVVRFGKNP